MKKRKWRISSLLSLIFSPFIVAFSIISAVMIYDFNRVEVKLQNLIQDTVPRIYFANNFSINLERLRGCIESIHFSHDIDYARQSFELATSILDRYSFHDEPDYAKDKRRLQHDLEIFLGLRKQTDSIRYDTMLLLHRFLHNSYMIGHEFNQTDQKIVSHFESDNYLSSISMQMQPDIQIVTDAVEKQNLVNIKLCKNNESNPYCTQNASLFEEFLLHTAALRKDIQGLSDFRAVVDKSYTRVTRSLINGELSSIETALDESYVTLESSEPYIYIFVILTLSGLLALIYVLHHFIVQPIATISDVISSYIDRNQIKQLPYTRVKEISIIKNQIQDLFTNIAAHKEGEEQIRGKYDALRTESKLDSLTQVYNRHYLNKYINENQNPADDIAVLMCDIDKFKKFNDTHGHLAGDETLKSVAAALKKVLRSEDTIIRYGGEEFCIILKDIDLQSLRSSCIRLVKAVEQLNIINNGNGNKPITISIGAVHYSVNRFSDFNLTWMIDIADNALYKVKDAGGNAFYIDNYYEKHDI